MTVSSIQTHIPINQGSQADAISQTIESVIQAINLQNRPASEMIHSFSSNPFQKPILKPLLESIEHLSQLRNAKTQTEKEPIIKNMHELADTMVSFVNQYLEASKKRVQEETDDHKDNGVKAYPSAPVVPVAFLVHELRTPLTGILGCLEDYQDELFEDLQDAYLHLSKISASLGSDEVLLSVIPETFTMKRLIKNVRHQIVKYDKRVKVQFKYPHLKVVGDFQKLSQVLINLISNAIKYSPKPGIVHMEITNEYPEMRAEHDYILTFKVKDNGPGIPKHIKQRLFQAYSTGDAAIDTNAASTGIGLTLSQQFVELMGGMIRIDSDPNQAPGTIFYFMLEMAHPKRNHLSTRTELSPMASYISSQNEIYVLAADDQEMVRKIIQRALKTMNPTIVHSGEDILNQNLSDYHVILLDMNMGDGLTGLQTAETIRKLGHQIPIIIVSGEEVDVSKLENVETHPKPIQRVKLQNRVKELAETHLKLLQNVG